MKKKPTVKKAVKKAVKKTVKKKAAKKKKPTMAQLVQQVQDKFIELKKIRAQLNKVKSLYKKHDELMEELLPLFIKIDSDTFTITRSLTVGNKKYNLNPHFYDTKKAIITAKVWKSSAFATATIE